METELWPTLLHQCHRRGIRLLLINGRISQRSYPRYQKISSLIAPTVSRIDRILAQSQHDPERFISLGAKVKTVSTGGNLKYDMAPPPSGIEQSAETFLSQLQNRQIWVVGSTHDNEEQIILQAFAIVRMARPELLLVVAPRHPERVSQLKVKIAARGLQMVLRSENKIPSKNDNVWLIDTMGELLLFYKIATVCTVAGSFDTIGGHNPLEPALFSKPTVVGPHMTNFEDIMLRLKHAQGVIQTLNSSAEELARNIEDMISHSHSAKQLGANAAAVLKENQGATEKSVNALSEILSENNTDP